MNPVRYDLYQGDSLSLDIPLTWQDSPFEPGADWILLATVKANSGDADEDAVFQKSSTAGISVTGSTATLDIVNADTEDVSPGALVADIRAEHVTSGARRVVAKFHLDLRRPVSRSTTPSIPIHTTLPGTSLVSLEAVLTLLGVTSYASLAAANTALPIGKPFYNLATSKLDITTA